MRITLQLIDARDDDHLWAQSYERDLSDVLALQGEIAGEVAREVALTVMPAEETRLSHARPLDPEANDAYEEAKDLREPSLVIVEPDEPCEPVLRVAVGKLDQMIKEVRR